MAKKINVVNIMAGLDEVAAQTEEFSIMSKPQSIPIKEIVFNPDNLAAENDTPESIKGLADSIALTGLIHPLTVNRIEEHQYMLLSGERRLKAITTHLNWKNVQCTVYDNLDSSMATVATVEANMETRQYTIPQRLKLYQQLDNALHDLKERGLFKGGISQEIAKRIKVNKAQISKYKTIIENLTPEKIQQIKNINEAVEMIRAEKKLPKATFLEQTESVEREAELPSSEQSDVTATNKAILKNVTNSDLSSGNIAKQSQKKLPEATFSEQAEPAKRKTEITFSEQPDLSQPPVINLDTLLETESARYQLRQCIGWNGRQLNDANDFKEIKNKLSHIISAYKELYGYLQTHSSVIKSGETAPK